MDEGIYVIAAMICVTILLAVLILVLGKMKSQKQELLKTLVDEGKLSQEQISDLLATDSKYTKDFRRGVLLVGLGVSLGVFFFFMGGVGWKLAIIPIFTGLIYLWFWWLNVKNQ